jgi:hypothetical protein
MGSNSLQLKKQSKEMTLLGKIAPPQWGHLDLRFNVSFTAFRQFRIGINHAYKITRAEGENSTKVQINPRKLKLTTSTFLPNTPHTVSPFHSQLRFFLLI